MQAIFGTLAKRDNSTKQQEGGASYSIVLKEGCSTLNPTIRLKWTGAGSPVAYNHVKIPAFDREYWIDSWIYEDRQWTAVCRVDVLASWKGEIGSTPKYILRCSADQNNNVVDLKYPAIFPWGSTAFPINLGWATNFSGGTFIISVVGNGNSVGGASFYGLNSAGMERLISSAFTETADLWSTPLAGSDLSSQLADYGVRFFKSIVNPAQFINSIHWVPFPVSGGGPGNTIKLGDINTGVQSRTFADTVHTIEFEHVLPGTPVDEPAELSVPPFLSYRLYMPPFGVFALDARMMRQSYGIRGKIYVDVTNGESVLEVYPRSGGSGPIIIASGNIGCPIQIGGSNVDYAGLAQSSLSTAGNIVDSVLHLDIAGAITGGASGIIDAARVGAPTATNGGYGGGLSALRSFCGIVAEYMTRADVDVTDQGHPLMEKRIINTLPGYILCADGEVQAPASKTELEMIAKYMTGGFYYE